MVFLREWLWHHITHEIWYTIEQIARQRFFHENGFDIILPTKFDIPLNKLHHNGFSTRMALTSYYPRSLIYHWTNCTTTVFPREWLWHHITHEVWYTIEQIARQRFFHENGFDIITHEVWYTIEQIARQRFFHENGFDIILPTKFDIPLNKLHDNGFSTRMALTSYYPRSLIYHWTNCTTTVFPREWLWHHITHEVWYTIEQIARQRFFHENGFDIILPTKFDIPLNKLHDNGFSREWLWHHITHEIWYTIEQIARQRFFHENGFDIILPTKFDIPLNKLHVQRFFHENGFDIILPTKFDIPLNKLHDNGFSTRMALTLYYPRNLIYHWTNCTTTVFPREWLWHYITHEIWYTIEQIARQRFFHENGFDIILPTKFDIPLNKLHDNGFSTRMALTSYYPRSLIYHWTNCTTMVFLREWLWHHITHEVWYTIEQIAPQWFFYENGFDIITHEVWYTIEQIVRQRFFQENGFDIILPTKFDIPLNKLHDNGFSTRMALTSWLPTKFDIPLNKLHDNGFSTRMALTSYYPRSLIYHWTNCTTTVFPREWLWHHITHEVWYTIEQIARQRFFHENGFDIILPTKFDIPLNKLHDNGFSTRMALTSYYPRSLIYHWTNCTTTVFPREWLWHHITHEIWYTIEQIARQRFFHENGFDIILPTKFDIPLNKLHDNGFSTRMALTLYYPRNLIYHWTNCTTTVFPREWLWHYITHEIWYTIEQIARQRFFHENGFDIILPTKFDIPLNKLHDNGFSTRMALTLYYPRNLIYHWTNCTTTVFPREWLWHYITHEIWYTIEQIARQRFFHENGFDIILPTKFDIPLNKLHDNGFSTRMALTLYYPRSLIYQWTGSTLINFLFTKLCFVRQRVFWLLASPVGWGCKIHRLLLTTHRTSMLLMTLNNQMVRLLLEIWGMWSTPSLPLLPGPPRTQW